ncbi:hypothetical protein AUP43_15545 [Oceanibaculum pacificum]|uniref:Uncharacterized protein n=1 Tax=Oceanibaculum pacificum TaxID=580166 RepID=A0A154WGM8_9PROT|nr:hypothetical protein AUP43_15545 [Oceanibaculum pacificum]
MLGEIKEMRRHLFLLVAAIQITQFFMQDVVRRFLLTRSAFAGGVVPLIGHYAYIQLIESSASAFYPSIQ